MIDPRDEEDIARAFAEVTGSELLRRRLRELGLTEIATDAEGNVIARGLTNYSSADVERIKGLKSDKIAHVLGRLRHDRRRERERPARGR